jgi:hypothetical protein
VRNKKAAMTAAGFGRVGQKAFVLLADLDSLAHIRLEHAEGGLMTLDRHAQRGQQSLCSEMIQNDPLIDSNRLVRNANWLCVQAKIDNQLFRRTGDSAEIRV